MSGGSFRVEKVGYGGRSNVLIEVPALSEVHWKLQVADTYDINLEVFFHSKSSCVC